MLADEGGQAALKVYIEITKDAVKVVSKVVDVTARSLYNITRMAGHGLSQAVSRQLNTGSMSLSRLRRNVGPDLKSVAISPQMARSLRADLRRRGVSFSIEKGADGHSYVHFSGKDINTVRHGLAQVQARISREMKKSVNQPDGRTAQRPSRQRRQEPGAGRRQTRSGRQVKSRRQTLDGIRSRQRAMAGKRAAAPMRSRPARTVAR
ncbi:DUF3801 domain-containing protein [Actinomyces howellii]|uniref:DUF3801 domain-containing protein n=1 Tax=Actinomyces howellii TaxID=52771 RepID=A0A3S4UXS9_9ACTO|nr:DUF3801 domain-containing protein [Actinomyces howellii]VEG28515.1 Uncharacterised protein [Actinomyces howellii]